MKLKPGNLDRPLRPGEKLGRGDIAKQTGWAPQQLAGGKGTLVKQFGNRVVVTARPMRQPTVGSGTGGVTFLGEFDYFPEIPERPGKYCFLYTTESQGYTAYGGQTAWTAEQKLTTSTGIPA